MRVDEIYIAERRQQKTRLMYHGTSSKLVRSILKQGLLAEPPKRTYDVPDDGPDEDQDSLLNTYGGVYITSSEFKAKSIAEDAVDKHGGRPAIVTLRFVHGSGNLDEDTVIHAIGNAAISLIRTITDDHKFSAENMSEEDVAEWINAHDDYALEVSTKHVIAELIRHANLNDTAKYAIRDIFDEIFTGITAEVVSEFKWGEGFIGLIQPRNLRPKIEEIMTNINTTLDYTAPRGINMQLTRDIKFKGKTRIIEISIEGDVVYKENAQ